MTISALNPLPDIPRELWAMAFAYVDEVDTLPPKQISQFRLLSSAMSEGLDEWLIEGIDQGVKRNGGLRLVPTRLPPMNLQKLALIALSKAPTEFFGSILRLEEKFLVTPEFQPKAKPSRRQLPRHPSIGQVERDVVESVLAQLRGVSEIGSSFLARNERLQRVDLSAMTQLTTIGSKVLVNSSVVEVVLPRSLRSVGDYFLAESSVKKVDLSETSIETVGFCFLNNTAVETIVLPPSLKRTGEHFLAKTSATKVDLFQTGLKTAEDHFFSNAKADELLLPPSLESAENDVLAGSSVKTINLSQTCLETVGDDFLCCGVVKEGVVLLPSTLKCVGNSFLSRSSFNILNLSHTQLTTVGENFLRTTKANEIQLRLPPSLGTAGKRFLVEIWGRKLDIDVSSTKLEFIPENSFWNINAKLELLVLPPSLRKIGPHVLCGLNIKKIDLSQTTLVEAKSGLLERIIADEVLFPSSLKSIDRYFLSEASVKKVDLSQTQVEELGNYCLQTFTADELLLPPSLKLIGEEVLTAASLKRLDLSRTSLQVVGNSFLSGATADEVVLPQSLRTSVHRKKAFWKRGMHALELLLSGGRDTKRTALEKELANGQPNCWSMPGRSLVMPLEDQTKRSIFADEPETLETIVRCCWDIPLPMLTPIESVLMGLLFLGPNFTSANHSTADSTAYRSNPRYSVAVAVRLAFTVQCDPRLSILEPCVGWNLSPTSDSRGGWVVGFRPINLKNPELNRLLYHEERFPPSRSRAQMAFLGPQISSRRHQGFRSIQDPLDPSEWVVTRRNQSLFTVHSLDCPEFNGLPNRKEIRACPSEDLSSHLCIAVRYQHKDVFLALWGYCLKKRRVGFAALFLDTQPPRRLHSFFYRALCSYSEEKNRLPRFLSGVLARDSDFDFRAGVSLSGCVTATVTPRGLLSDMANSLLPFGPVTDQAIFAMLRGLRDTQRRDQVFILEQEYQGGAFAGHLEVRAAVWPAAATAVGDAVEVVAADRSVLGRSIPADLGLQSYSISPRTKIPSNTTTQLEFARWLLELPIWTTDGEMESASGAQLVSINGCKLKLLECDCETNVYGFVVDHRMKRRGYRAQDEDYDAFLSVNLSTGHYISFHLERGNIAAAEWFERELTVKTTSGKLQLFQALDVVVQRVIGLALCRFLLGGRSTKLVESSEKLVNTFLRRYPGALTERFTGSELDVKDVDFSHQPSVCASELLYLHPPLLQGVLTALRDPKVLNKLPTRTFISSALRTEVLAALGEISSGYVKTLGTPQLHQSRFHVIHDFLGHLPHPILPVAEADLIDPLRSAMRAPTAGVTVYLNKAGLDANGSNVSTLVLLDSLPVAAKGQSDSNARIAHELLFTGAYCILARRWRAGHEH